MAPPVAASSDVRFRSVRFEPFGSLRGVELDFGAETGRVNLVWGPNEAGKSTALRGIVGFLFGIKRDSTDQHERGVELRVRARLIVDGGREVELVRRKGTKDPLRDGATDAAVPERELTRWLGGVDEATFLQLHALDHDRLREGASSIVRGEGRIGELMLEATTGVTGLTDRLQALKEEADTLHRPRAKSTALSVAVEGWKGATKGIGQESLLHSAWEKQVQGIAQTEERVAEADQKLKAARADLARLEKLASLDDPLVRLRNRRARRAQLGEVADVAEGTAQRRDELAQELAAAIAEAERAEAELPRLTVELEAARRRAAGVAPSFDRVRAHELRTTIESLAQSTRTAAAELDEIARTRDEALDRLGDPAEGLPWAARTVDDASAKHAETCATDRRVARAALAVAARAATEARARLDAAPTIDEENGDGAVEPLVAAIAGGRRASATAAVADALAARELDLVQRVAVALAATSRPTVEGLAGSTVPDSALVDEELRRRAAHGAESANLERDIRAADARAARAATELTRLGEGTVVPSEAELAEARRVRDEAVDRAAEALDAGALDRARQELRAVGRALRVADAASDRLRKEASRVQQAAGLEVEVREATTEAAALAARLGDVRRRETERDAAFRASWPSLSGIALETARAWLSRRTDALSAQAELTATREQRAGLHHEVSTAARALADVGHARGDDVSRSSLDAALAEAEQRLEQARTAGRRREERLALRARATADLDAAARAHDAAVAEADRADETWRVAMARHGIDAATPSEAGLAILTALRDATRETRRLDRAAARLARANQALEEARRAWTTATTEAGLTGVAPEEALQRAEAAREARTELPRIEEAMTQRRDVGRAARARAERASARLAELVERAGVPPDRLAAAEERSREARKLDVDIAGLEATVVDMTGATSMEVAEEQLRDVDFAVVTERAEEVRADIESLEASRSRDQHAIGGARAELESMGRGRSAAADLAETAEAHLARARGLARRAAVARVAVALLEGEIERHRAEREGPVLRRASELFHLLTAKRWSGLRVGEGAESTPEIRCVRDERESGVKELSEGTVDQLYLALRLAALEHHASVGVPLPLILDDVLLNCDDERTEAALVALAEVARTVQVLLFTHERQVVEIAQRALPTSGLAVHELSRTP